MFDTIYQLFVLFNVCIMEDILEKIKKFADQAHGEQKRKYTPDRYIVHPVRVKNICREYTNDITILAAALLHDVLEDTPVSSEEIKFFLLTLMDSKHALKTLMLVEDLTDIYTKEKYPELNRKRRKIKEAERLENIHADAQTVKYADLIDNSLDICVHDKGFAGIFLKEANILIKKMNKGNKELHHRAAKTLNECLRDLYK
jgi:(p)ppGpp synthase/HD superfamily hydrolase